MDVNGAVGTDEFGAEAVRDILFCLFQSLYILRIELLYASIAALTLPLGIALLMIVTQNTQENGIYLPYVVILWFSRWHFSKF